MDTSGSSEQHPKSSVETEAESKQDTLQQSLSEPSQTKQEQTKTGKKSNSRRRKGASKPRRIRQSESDLEFDTNIADEKGKSLDVVLKRVLKAKQVEEQLKNGSLSNKKDKMIELHESLSIHHSPKNVRCSTTSPGSVESAASLYSNERAEDNMSDNGITNGIEPFVKIRHHSNENLTPERQTSYDQSAALQRSLSSDSSQRRQSLSPVSSPKESKAHDMPLPETMHVSAPHGRSPPHIPAGIYMGSSSAYDAIAGNPTNAIVAMATGIGLPGMVPTSAIMTSTVPPLVSIQEQQRYRFEGASHAETKNNSESSLSHTNGNTNPNARGIIGSSGGASRTTVSPSPEDRAQYKRPPHTYPALIASAILDSTGHLITLRGIYDYIMNHFPYYKYCHDKSAWQNSIRHNLSLNQCFVKVPRYENAAKSNYWTMTREGFEEFGNENSFKRRRRRGAALAPISAYKAKKYQNEGAKNNGKNKSDSRQHPSANGASPTSAGSEEQYSVPFRTQFMELAGAWPPGFRPEENSGKGRKRSQSPVSKEGMKHPRMMILKQGDGPSLGGIKGEEQKRPNSLSSVEEMQGTLNSFSKTLLDSSVLAKVSRKMDTPPHLLTTTAQPWMSEAQKNLIASSGMFIPPLLTAENVTSAAKASLNSRGSEESASGSEVPVTMDGIEIGSELTIRYDASEIPIRHFRCRFCTYTYVGTSVLLLEQHCRMLHQLELTNARAKAVAAATMAKPQSDRASDNSQAKDIESSDRLMSLQNMVSSLSPRSMMAAAQSNAQHLLAAAQASVGSTTPGFPYAGSFSSGLIDDSMMRSIAEQVNTSQGSHSNGDLSNGLTGIDAYALQRQQVLNNAFQQAAAASSTATGTSQEQLRMFYQQLAMHNPFLANSANSALGASFPRQIPVSESEQSSQLKQQLLQYQQKLFFSQMKALSDENARTSPNRNNSTSDDTTTTEYPVNHQNSSSPTRNTASDADSDSKKNIHGWKQCGRCDFTAKGDHGLELHHRKAHAQIKPVTSSVTSDPSRTSPNLATPPVGSEMNEKALSGSCTTKFEEQCDSPLAANAFPTPPLSNSPSYVKRNFTPLDLSGKDEEMRKSPGVVATASTQTTSLPSKDDQCEARTCTHCDIVFGDEMMHALHMSCHDKNDPFKCTICGQLCQEKYYFNVHLLRGLHQSNSNNNIKSKAEQGSEETNDIESASRRPSNSSDSSSVTSRSRLNSDNSEVVSYQ